MHRVKPSGPHDFHASGTAATCASPKAANTRYQRPHAKAHTLHFTLRLVGGANGAVVTGVPEP